jgi:hypothetical protein
MSTPQNGHRIAWRFGGRRLEFFQDDRLAYAGTARKFLAGFPGVAAQLPEPQVRQILRTAQEENDQDERAQRQAARYASGELSEAPWVDDDGKTIVPGSKG